jgi:hypothetical protein
VTTYPSRTVCNKCGEEIHLSDKANHAAYKANHSDYDECSSCSQTGYIPDSHACERSHTAQWTMSDQQRHDQLIAKLDEILQCLRMKKVIE